MGIAWIQDEFNSIDNGLWVMTNYGTAEVFNRLHKGEMVDRGCYSPQPEIDVYNNLCETLVEELEYRKYDLSDIQELRQVCKERELRLREMYECISRIKELILQCANEQRLPERLNGEVEREIIDIRNGPEFRASNVTTSDCIKLDNYKAINIYIVKDAMHVRNSDMFKSNNLVALDKELNVCSHKSYTRAELAELVELSEQGETTVQNL
jgi:hypothetical protein